ncbi:type II secretion system protein GspN [Limisalsivibrio acetivorans]|uniref:type II secretion system protein GspN n=1 Tax=Limisalsivibrio acetivorans TaxID=1304888 RepID=UPI0003B52414|nr:type II secretion system protein GspN [Limisalsivibrio acetivorans]
MIKKSAIAIAIFLLSVLVFTPMFFPWNTVAEYYIRKAVSDNRIPARIDSIKAGPGGAVISGISIEDIEITQIRADYSLLSVITKSADVSVNSPLGTIETSIDSGSVEARGLLDMKNIGSLLNQSLDGDMAVQLNMNLNEQTGDIVLTSDSFTVPTDFGPMPLKNLRGEGTINKNTIDVTSLTSEGNAKLDITGKITINTRDIGRSMMNMSGTVDVMGAKQNITARGLVRNPRITAR